MSLFVVTGRPFLCLVRLQKRLFDFTSDVVFAALAITSWRLYFGGYI